MGYRTSNAAIAYDMQPQPSDYRQTGSAAPVPALRESPERARRPRLDVLTGAGREADQAVSPVFAHVIKVVLIIVALFVVVGGARVALAGATSGVLDANAGLSSKLEADQAASSDLEVMRSVYGSSARIRDLAGSTLGMVEATDGVTIDLSADASGAASQGTTASGAATTSGATAAE